MQHLPKRAADKVNKWMEQEDGRRRRWLEEHIKLDAPIFGSVTATTYILKAMTGLGYLALMWSTVVLLGGFVTVLQKKDFWSVTIISMVQAVRSVMFYSRRLLCRLHTHKVCVCARAQPLDYITPFVHKRRC